MQENVVTTTGGRVRGTASPRSADGSVTVHRSIPYAAPPFGGHRFAAPAPAAPWDGVRDCTVFGGRLGACHALDLPFAFGNLDGDFGAFLFEGGPGQEHHALSARMVAAWRDFAATGDPGWPASTGRALAVKEWNTTDALYPAPAAPARAVWADVPLAPR